MPDGTLMADDAHVVQEGMGEDEQMGSGLGDWIANKAHEFKNYWTDPDEENHHEFFLDLAQHVMSGSVARH